MSKLIKSPFFYLFIVALVVYITPNLLYFDEIEYYKPLDKNGLIMELDENFNKLWENREFAKPGFYGRTKNGDKLICDKTNHISLMTDNEGNIEWMYPVISGIYLEETNEKTFVSSSEWGNQGVFEVDKLGNILWQMSEISGRAECHKIAPNRYLVSSYLDRFVKIFDENKNVVHTIASGYRVNSVQALPDNRFLIADYNAKRVIEVDFDGNIFWQFAFNNLRPYAARKLNNGNYVVALSDHNVYLVDKNKNLIATINGYLVSNISIMPDGHIGIAGIKH